MSETSNTAEVGTPEESGSVGSAASGQFVHADFDAPADEQLGSAEAAGNADLPLGRSHRGLEGVPPVGADGRVGSGASSDSDAQLPRSSASISPVVKRAEDQQQGTATIGTQPAPRPPQHEPTVHRAPVVSAAQTAQRGENRSPEPGESSDGALTSGESADGAVPQEIRQPGERSAALAAEAEAEHADEAQLAADEHEGVDDPVNPEDRAAAFDDSDSRMALGSDRVSPTDDSAAMARHFKHARHHRRPDLEIRIGHDELVLRQRYEIISIVNDLLLGLWFVLGSILFFGVSTAVGGTVLFLIGSLQMLLRPAIRLVRRMHLQKVSPLMTGSAAPTESTMDF